MQSLKLENLSSSPLETYWHPIQSLLSRSGFCLVEGAPHECDVSVCAVDAKTTPEDWFDLGIRFGAGQNLVLLSLEPDRLPEKARKLPCVDLRERSHQETLLDILGGLMGTESLSAPEDSQDLLQWLAKDWDRLKRLSIEQLAVISKKLFRTLGFGVSHPRWANSNDLVVTEPKSKLRILIQCRAASMASSIVDVGEVHSLYSDCRASEIDLAVLVTNGGFSRAAYRRARSCIPPLYLFDAQSLTSVLASSLEERVGRTHESPFLFLNACSVGPDEERQGTERAFPLLRGEVGSGKTALSVKYLRLGSMEHKPDSLHFVSHGAPEKRCVVLVSGGDSAEAIEDLNSQVTKLGVHSCDLVSVSSFKSARSIKELKGSTRVWILSPGLFSDRRSRSDRLALEWLAHYYDEGNATKPSVIIGAADAVDLKLRAPVCFAREAVYLGTEEPGGE